MQFYFQKRKSLSLAMAICLMVLFQNCTGGFKVFDVEDVGAGAISQSSTTDQVTANPGILFEGKMSELQSVTVKLDGTGPLTFPGGLPKGALYDPNLRRLNWIPTRGQAGTYNIKVHEADQVKGFVILNVGAVSDQQLASGGPPFLYNDGDVGYIFVHGKGDLDRCSAQNDLGTYWGNGPQIVAPDAATRLIACYDGRKAVADTAAGVARQILNANCGRYNRCIIFTHSMGGLMLEHMFTHARDASPLDPEPRMFENRELYKAVRERTLFVVSLASAAGGSDSASIVNSDGPRQLGQEAIGAISRLMGANNDATRNLVVSYATRVVAPVLEDPKVPFFMIPGFSERTTAEQSGFLGSIFNAALDRVPLIVFNGNRELALLDSVVLYQARSDGLVDFRSSCGVQSDVEGEGAGRKASLDEHFRYCWNSRKKPNHYVWFISNLNHYLITGQPYDCRNNEAPCVALFPDPANATFTMDRSFTGLNVMEVVRRRLADPNQTVLRKLATVQ